MSLEIHYDPHKQWPQAKPEDIINSLGFLFPWAMEYEHFGNSVALAMEKHYMYFDQWRHLSADSVVTQDYIWNYPGDPPMYPLAIIINNEIDEIVIFYPHAMIIKAHKDLSNAQYTRMD